jgi:hypothetical protein
MMDDRDGIDRLRGAIDEVADGLPARGRPRRAPARIWTVAVACVVAAAGIAIYLKAPRLAPREAIAVPGVEVRLLRVRGRDVQARVFDVARAGTVVIAPEVPRKDAPRPVGAAGLAEGGSR